MFYRYIYSQLQLPIAHRPLKCLLREDGGTPEGLRRETGQRMEVSMFKHRDVPHCQRCGDPLVLYEDGAAANMSPADREWKCPTCGVQRPLVYLVERSLKKAV